MSIDFSKEIIYDSGEVLFFKYEGISPSVDTTKKITEEVNFFMNDSSSHNNMCRNITYLRTILKDCDEKLFVISYKDILGNYEEVKYYEGKLFNYVRNKHIDNMLIKIEKTSADFKIDFCNSDEDFATYSNSKIINKQIKEALMRISSLKNIKIVDINSDANRLINIYNSFYGENPDFDDIDIRDKSQAMMNILESFGITLGDNYVYYIFGGKENPMSMKLETLLLNLKPLGKIVINNDSKTLSDSDRNKVQVIGDFVKENINSMEELVLLSRVINIDRKYGEKFDMSLEDDKNKEQINSNVQKIKAMKEIVKRESA